jgi:hypothetical protein
MVLNKFAKKFVRIVMRTEFEITIQEQKSTQKRLKKTLNSCQIYNNPPTMIRCNLYKHILIILIMGEHTFRMNQQQFESLRSQIDIDGTDYRIETIGSPADNHYLIRVMHGRRTIARGSYYSVNNPPFRLRISDSSDAGANLVGIAGSLANESRPRDRRSFYASSRPVRITNEERDEDQGENVSNQDRPNAIDSMEEPGQFVRREVQVFRLTSRQVRNARRRLARLGIRLDTGLYGRGIVGSSGARIGTVEERGHTRIRRPMRDGRGRVYRQHRAEDDGRIVRDGDDAKYVGPDARRDNANPHDQHAFTGEIITEDRLISTITLSLDNTESPQEYQRVLEVFEDLGISLERTDDTPQPAILGPDDVRFNITGEQYDELARQLARYGPADARLPGYDFEEWESFENGTVHGIILRNPDSEIIARGYRYEGLDDDRVILTFENNIQSIDNEGPVRQSLARVGVLNNAERAEPRTMHLEQREFLELAQDLPRGYRIDASGEDTVLRNHEGRTIATVEFDHSAFNPNRPISANITSSDPRLIALLRDHSSVNENQDQQLARV